MDPTLQATDGPPLDRVVAACTERQCREQLSALLDGALPADEARFLLRRLRHDRALAGHWERWQVYGDALRGSTPALLPADFALRVAAALQGDAQAVALPVAAAAGGRVRRLRWGAGAALAASVAVAALFVVQRAPPRAGVGPSLELAASSQAGAPSPSTPPAAGDGGGTRTPGGSGGVAAAVAGLAMVEPVRRSARRDRQAAARRSVAMPQAGAGAEPRVAAVETAAPAARVVAAVGAAPAAPPAVPDPFAGDGSLVARPWPRAVLPAMDARAITVDYGRAPPADGEGFEPFAPRVPVDVSAAREATP